MKFTSKINWKKIGKGLKSFGKGAAVVVGVTTLAACAAIADGELEPLRESRRDRKLREIKDLLRDL